MIAIKANLRAPKTIGLIMDGSRRFARAHNLPLFRGHEAGYEKFQNLHI